MLPKKSIKHFFLIGLIWIVIFSIGACGPARLTQKDVDKLSATAKEGNPTSQILIGEMYEFGEQTSADPAEAAGWYKRAAQADNPEAQFYLGIMYDRGEGVTRNASEAMRLLFQSGQQGWKKAQILLAALYFKDPDLRQQFDGKIKQYKQSAASGNSEAQYHLGWIYREGVGTPMNPQKALKWYRKAAEQGNAKAQLALGDIYLEGSIAPADPVEAIQWYRQSAETKISARIKLCQLYEGAYNSQKNEEEAEKCSEALDQSIDETLAEYIEMQHAILNTVKEKNPARALRACDRISKTDPQHRRVEEQCTLLRQQASHNEAPKIQEARSALKQGDWITFRGLLFQILTPDFDQSQVRRLVAAAWQLLETETRKQAKLVKDILFSIENAEQFASYRRKHTKQIPEWINSFSTTLEEGLKAYPSDTELLDLAQKGRETISSLQEKMKPPPPKKIEPKIEKKVKADKPTKAPAPKDPAEDYFQKAKKLFAQGQFSEAASLFKKISKIRGTRYIAKAYIYLGLTYLAQTSPANIYESRKLHLKGLSCFQNALRFDRNIGLPAGFKKYEPDFQEAKKRLR